jgi:hypothetical protein
MAKVLGLTADGTFEEIPDAVIRHQGVSLGTGADQEISHGFSAVPRRLELVPLDVGQSTVFSGRTVEATHFHITVTAGRNFAWVAEDW